MHPRPFQLTLGLAYRTDRPGAAKRILAIRLCEARAIGRGRTWSSLPGVWQRLP